MSKLDDRYVEYDLANSINVLPVEHGGTGIGSYNNADRILTTKATGIPSEPIRIEASAWDVDYLDALTSYDPIKGPFEARLQALENSELPHGLILLWSGAVGLIPAGWTLCDGTNSTPNLMDKFIIGAGDTYNVGGAGGNKDAVSVSHSHTFTGNALGNHRHSGIRRSTGGTSAHPVGNVGDQPWYWSGNSNTDYASAGTPSGTISAGGVSGTDKNLPPYYALCYIMKINN